MALRSRAHYLQWVIDFHTMLNLPAGNKPKLISQKAYARRMRLILEELSEYSKAVSNNNIVEIADALGDILFVVFGAAVEHGLPMDRIFSEICNSNMTKKDGYMDEGGKWIKPPNYKPVDLTWLHHEEKKTSS